MAATADVPARRRKSPTLALLRTIFGALVGLLTFVGECAILIGESAKRLFARPHETGEVINQMAFIGVSSVPIVVLTTFFSGAVLAQYSAEILIRYGASTLAGATVGMAVVREIGPVLAGIMVAARCGSAMAAQIGSMAVTEQIDALRALSVPPVNYLVIPRIVASVVMLPVLALVGMYSGILGGYIVAGAQGIPGGTFIQSIQQFVEPEDILKGMFKTIVFGLIVTVTACQQGLRTTEGAVGVGRATTNTVVVSMVLIYMADYLLATVLY